VFFPVSVLQLLMANKVISRRLRRRLFCEILNILLTTYCLYCSGIKQHLSN